VKTIPFLRDIDDEEHYAKQLELCWHMVLERLAAIQGSFPIIPQCAIQSEQKIFKFLDEKIFDTYADLANMMHTMRLIGRDMADRRRRLADRAVGLTDGVFDEEGP